MCACLCQFLFSPYPFSQDTRVRAELPEIIGKVDTEREERQIQDRPRVTFFFLSFLHLTLLLCNTVYVTGSYQFLDKEKEDLSHTRSPSLLRNRFTRFVSIKRGNIEKISAFVSRQQRLTSYRHDKNRQTNQSINPFLNRKGENPLYKW